MFPSSGKGVAAMSLRQVRCPHCSRRSDVTGVAVGTRLRCGGCDVVLSVPAFPAPRPRPLFPIAAGTIAVLATLALLALVLRPAPPDIGAAPIPAPTASPAVLKPLPVDPGLGIIDDPVSRLRQEIGAEFPSSRFSCFDALRPYFIALESSDRFVDGGRIQEYARHLELAHTAFRRDVADRIGLPPVKDALLPVLVLGSREQFDQYCERRNGKRPPSRTKGMYEYCRRRIVTYQDVVVSRDQILHEGVHQLMHHYQLLQTGSRTVHLSFWLQEGVANYFEGFRRRVDGEVALDRASDGRRFPLLRNVAASRDLGEFVPLVRLVDLTVDGYWDLVDRLRFEDPRDADRKAQICYAESWALVHFLRQSGPAHRRVFEDYLRRELAGGGSRRAFAEVVQRELGLSVAELESKFVAYIRSLK